MAAMACACLLLSGAATASTATILVLGDSLSAAYGLPADAGWVSLLQKRLTAQGFNRVVVNASISGETSAGGDSRIAGVLAQFHPDIVILELGANDGLRGLPVQQMSLHLNSIVARCRAARSRVLILGMRMPPNYGARYTSEFAQAFSDLARTSGSALVPFMLERVAGHADLIQEDGLHPTAAGQPLILDTVWPQLVALLGRP